VERGQCVHLAVGGEREEHAEALQVDALVRGLREQAALQRRQVGHLGCADIAGVRVDQEHADAEVLEGGPDRAAPVVGAEDQDTLRARRSESEPVRETGAAESVERNRADDD
jgi:hypothetical protein